jgi:hypothetical protein
MGHGELMLRASPKLSVGLVAAGASLATDKCRLCSGIGGVTGGCPAAVTEELNGNTPREDDHRDERHRDEYRRFGKETWSPIFNLRARCLGFRGGSLA